MKILIIDDKPQHQEAARRTLAGHELTILTTPDEAFNIFEGEPQGFEAVLLDMQMPNSDRASANRKSLDRESPYGLNFIWRAALLPNVKFIGLLTDANHHSTPMAAAYDGFPLDTIFSLNGAKVIHCRGKSRQFDGEDGQPFYGKDWGLILSYLTGEKIPGER